MVELQIDLSITPFDLDRTLCCGQVFRWVKTHKEWYGVVGETVIKLRQDQHFIVFQTYPKNLDHYFIERYFRFDDDLPNILENINRDVHINKAIRDLFGLRIIRQEPWECIISYLCATYVNIPRIQDMIERLSRMFGEKIQFEGKTFYTFPTRKSLANASLKDLLKCRVGYRAKHILDTAKLVYNNHLNLEALKKLNYDVSRHHLLSLKGIGPKVADCILLFSLDKLDAFPVDVWVQRIITEYYPKYFYRPQNNIREKQNLGSGKIYAFGRQYFGRYAGYAQEYLYYYYKGRV
jgi:N-glycosylase/DNA lyase